MQLKPLKIGDLVAERPIIQGGMGVGISLSSLAGAVAKEGGIGVISAAHPGYLEPDFDTNTREANLRGLGKHIQRARELSGGGIVGVNIMCAMEGYNDFVKCSVENGADLIISGAGLPADLPALVEGSKVKIAPIVSPPKAARVILKRWDKHYQRTADLVVIEGPKAGGHLGYSPEEVAAHAQTGYDKEILEILDIVKGYEDKYGHAISVVFAGGVFDHQDIAHFLSLGCAGVQIASRFVVTEECDADFRFKEAYLKARPEDITIVKSPVGMPGRAINNDFIRRTKVERDPITKCWNCLHKCDKSTIPYCITKALINAAKGDLDNALVFCGAEIGRLHQMTTVPKLMKELCG